MTEQRARYLLSHYLQKKSTPAEQQELFGWIRDSPDDALLERVLGNAWESFVPGAAIEKGHADRMLSQILAHDKPHVPEKNRSAYFLAPWMKWSVAAMLVISAGVIGYRSFTTPKTIAKRAVPTLKKAAAVPDVLPGTTAARLTLGDGSSILLDSVSGSEIADQGSTQIVRKDGRIIYESGASQPESVLYNTLTTDRGHQYPLTLSDGTKVFLNAASSIHFPVAFTGAQRTVEITGEAYFEVAKTGKPFAVLAAGVKIEVLGTHFNINSYADEAGMNTTLLEGSVKVTNGNNGLLLAPGQQANVQQDGSMKLNKHADTEAAISWTQGYFHFSDASLETVLRQLARWYDVNILYEKHYPDETFGGDIQKSLTLSQVLKILEKSQVRFRINGKQLIVMK